LADVWPGTKSKFLLTASTLDVLEFDKNCLRRFEAANTQCEQKRYIKHKQLSKRKHKQICYSSLKTIIKDLCLKEKPEP